MILESYEWKQAIKRNNAYVRRFRKSSPIDGSSSLLDSIQIRIAVNAFIVRRLLETPKISTYLREKRVPINAYPWTGSSVDYLNWHRIDFKYQINNPEPQDIPGKVLCDQIIHSFVWVWVVDEDEKNLNGFIVSSDRKKHSEAIIVNIDDWIQYTQEIANSSPTQIVATRNVRTKQWEFTSE